MNAQGPKDIIKVAEIPYPWVKKELTLDKTYALGDNGPKVKIIQEWLCLHDQQIRPDGDFGHATEYALRQFQKALGMSETGVVDEAVFNALILPILRVLTPLKRDSKTLSDLILAYAQRHLAEKPREVGGENCGPWVRLYMKGNQGKVWPWCAGFACFILGQAVSSMGLALPVEPSFKCDNLGEDARSQGLLVTAEDLAEGSPPKSGMPQGSFFLRRNSSDKSWVHTGLVMEFADEIFKTIEGNTNDDGSANGYEVLRQVHSYRGYDFIRIA
jgi:peptidoglycan hydrolase-like protein with peptidoglycan-binding domain